MNEFIKLLRDIIIVALIVLPIRTFIGLPFQISGSSMEETYHNGEIIIIDRFSFLPFMSDPKRGDVVVVNQGIYEDRRFLIKRVIGLPGDTLQFDGAGSVFLKPKGAWEFIKLDESQYLSEYNNGRTFLPIDVETKEIEVPEGSYFVMGDNRNGSADSRSCFMGCGIPWSTHFVSRKEVNGKFFIDLWYFPLLGDSGLFSTGKFEWKHKPRFFHTHATHSYKELEHVSAAP
jgi:signal peptidase I